VADRRLWITIGANISGLQAGLATAQQGVKDFDKSLQQNAARRQGINDLGTAFGKVGLAAAGGIALVVKSAMDWETAWTGVRKTVDGSEADLARLEGQLREMARTMPATHQEIAAVAEAAGQLGVATPNVAEFTRIMVELGETTNLTADEAATSLAQFMNVMQTAPDKVDNLGAALVALGNDGASTERDIVQMAQNIAGAGRTIGLSEADVLGIANALASVGIEAEAGGSAVSRIFIDMAKAAKTGSKELTTWAKVIGISRDEFKKLMADDPAVAFAAFTKGLGRINKEGGNVFKLLEDLGQSDVRVTRALLGMANSGDLLADSIQLGSEAMRDNTALSEEYGKRAETAAAKAQVAWNGIKDNLITIGSDALPVVKEFSESVAELTGWFSDLPPLVQGSVLKFLALTAALGGGGFVLSRTVTGFSNLANTLNNVSGSADKLTRSQLFARGGSLALGMGLLSISEAADDANVSLGAAATTASALLIGWGAGGPVGAAVATAGLFFKSIIEYSTEAEKRQRMLEERTERIVGLLDQQTGAVTKLAEAEQRRALAKDGTLKEAEAKGLNLGDVVKSSLGDEAAMARINEQLQARADAVRANVDAAGEWLNLPGRTGADIFGFESKAPLSLDDRRFASDLGIQADKIRQAQSEISQANRAAYESEGAFGAAAYGLAQAAGGADKYVGALDKLPKKVKTDIEQNGADASKASIAALAKAYDLTPKQVRTILEAIDNATGDLDDVRARMKRLDGMAAWVNVYARTDAARVAIAAIPGVGSPLSAVVNVMRVMSTKQADGSVLSFFGDGGMRENHVAQIAPAGSWRVWAEDETGGESYIPHAPSKRRRSLEIWAETGRILGVQGLANGGISGGSPPAGYVLPPGAQFRLVGADLIELVDSRVSAGIGSQANFNARDRRRSR